MVLYLLNDWERNGYNDSDFYAAYYDSEKNEIHATEYGSTRCAAPTMIGIDKDGVSSVTVNGQPLVLPTVEAIEAARKVLADYYFQRATKLDKLIVDEPNVEDLSVGLSMVTTGSVRNQVKATEPCRKCSGSGFWVNPRNASDKRECFTCKGSGQFATGPAKGSDGKVVWSKIEAGTQGTVVDHMAYGKFYTNGYNKPDRFNTTVTLKRADGSTFKVKLEKLKCAREYASPEKLRAQAERSSYGYQFQDATGCRCAWLTKNYVAMVLNKNKKVA